MGFYRHLAVAVTLALAVSPAAAFHTIFDYQVERVEVDGGAFGPADGTTDFVDEFDGGTLSPDWRVDSGTARVDGGVLHLTNPGTHIPYGPGIDVSEVAHTVLLHDGGGDFTITSWWTGGIREGDFVNLALYINGGTAGGFEFFGAAVARFGYGSDLSLQQYWGENLTLSDGHAVPKDASFADQPFAMRLSFSDATNEAVVSFSFDGGATFESPFDPIVIFRDRTDAYFVVGADPASASAPNCCTDNCT